MIFYLSICDQSFLSLSSSSGHLCIGFTLCSGPLRLCGSRSDGSLSLGVQPHREDPGGLSVRGGEVKVRLFHVCLMSKYNPLLL